MLSLNEKSFRKNAVPGDPDMHQDDAVCVGDQDDAVCVGDQDDADCVWKRDDAGCVWKANISERNILRQSEDCHAEFSSASQGIECITLM